MSYVNIIILVVKWFLEERIKYSKFDIKIIKVIITKSYIVFLFICNYTWDK